MSHSVEKTQNVVLAVSAPGPETNVYTLFLSSTCKIEKWERTQLEDGGLNTARAFKSYSPDLADVL